MYQFTEHSAKRFKELEKKFPKRSSLVLWALHLIQEDEGYIPQNAIDFVAKKSEVSSAWVTGVISFYEAFHTQKQGKYHFKVCYNATCWMKGSDDIENCIRKKLNINEGETTSDGLITFTRTQECLAGCDKAPVMQVNHTYHENLTKEGVVALIDSLQQKG